MTKSESEIIYKLVESVAELKTEIKNIEKSVTELAADFKNFKNEFAENKTKIKEIETGINNAHEKIKNHETRIHIIEDAPKNAVFGGVKYFIFEFIKLLSASGAGALIAYFFTKK